MNAIFIRSKKKFRSERGSLELVSDGIAVLTIVIAGVVGISTLSTAAETQFTESTEWSTCVKDLSCESSSSSSGDSKGDDEKGGDEKGGNELGSSSGGK